MNPVKVDFLQSQIYPSIFLFQIDRKIGWKTVFRWKTHLNSYWGVKIRMSFSHDFETFSFEFILDSILLKCLFEMPFKIQKNGVFLFEMSFFVLEISTFFYYAN